MDVRVLRMPSGDMIIGEVREKSFETPNSVNMRNPRFLSLQPTQQGISISIPAVMETITDDEYVTFHGYSWCVTPVEDLAEGYRQSVEPPSPIVVPGNKKLFHP